MSSQIIVKKGVPLVIDSRFPDPLYVDEFAMEDGAAVIIKRDITLNFGAVTIGKQCLIEASGESGPDGLNATTVPPQAGQITPGTHGYPGGDGRAGTRGWNLTFNWEIASIDDCVIRANGGRAGNGGNGGQGGKGGGAVCLGGDGRSGGDGGRGGNGGRGGDCGRVVLNWSSAIAANKSNVISKIAKEIGIPGLTSIEGMAAIPPGLKIEANAGDGGRAGKGGPGGAGGDGVECGLYARGGGPGGNHGPDGRSGRRGELVPPVTRHG